MNIFEALLLGVFQGITEFLPVSSSGHLVLAEHFLYLDATQLLPFDAIIHGGTLFSLLFLFHKEIKKLILYPLFPKKAENETKSLFWFLLVATIPVIAVGFLTKDSMDIFRSPQAVGAFFIVSAVLFVIAEKWPQKKEKKYSWQMIIAVGVFQIAALFPGISRSGTCTAAGILMGVSREKSTRFSFLLGIPVIAGAFLLSTIDVLESEKMPLLLPAIVGFLSAMISGFFMAKFLLQFFKNHSLYGFAIYLIIAAGFSFWML